MAYSDYGAFVFKNGKRVTENEDCRYDNRLVHGLIRDVHIAVVCYKQGLPAIYYNGNRVKYYDERLIDTYDFEPFTYKKGGYRFEFVNNDKPYEVTVATPSGDVWKCQYDYHYGAGFEDGGEFDE